MSALEDRIQSMLAADISLELVRLDAKADVPLSELRPMRDAQQVVERVFHVSSAYADHYVRLMSGRFRPQELARIQEIGGERARLYVAAFPDAERIHVLVQTRLFNAVWYALDWRCPTCKTDVVRSTQTPAGIRFDCGICELGIECFEEARK